VPDLVDDRVAKHMRDVLFTGVGDPQDAIVKDERGAAVLVCVAERHSQNVRIVGQPLRLSPDDHLDREAAGRTRRIRLEPLHPNIDAPKRACGLLLRLVQRLRRDGCMVVEVHRDGRVRSVAA